MTGKAYYITTLADWQRHAARFANSHFIVLDCETANSVVIPPALTKEGNPGPTHPVGDEGRAPGSSAVSLGGRARAIGEGSAVSAPLSDGAMPQQILRPRPKVGPPRNDNAGATIGEVEAPDFSPAKKDVPVAPSLLPQAVAQAPPERQNSESLNGSIRACPETIEDRRRILVLVEADEGVHLSLEDDLAFEPLPHPLAQKPVSDAAQAALAPHGVAPGATTFDAAQALARFHPLLKHRVF